LKITIIITAILFIYAIFSTFYHDQALIGDIGRVIGGTNIHLFGYFAYANMMLLLFPLLSLYRNPQARNNIDFYLGWMLIYIAIILFSSLVLDKAHVGAIGLEVFSFLKPYIGLAGLWLFWLMVTALAGVLMLDDDVDLTRWSFDVIPFKNLSIDESKKKAAFFSGFFKNPFASPAGQEHFISEYEEETSPANHAIPRPKMMQGTLPIDDEREESIEEILAEEPLVQKPKRVKKRITKAKPTPESTPMEDDFFEEALGEEAVKKVATASTGSKSKKTEATVSVKIVKELEENSKLLDELDKGVIQKPKNFKLPKLEFLKKAPKITRKVNEDEIDRKIEDLLSKLQQFKIDGDVIRTYSGPLVTTFEFKPAPNVKVSKILGLQDDLAMALSAETIRIQAPIPGRDVVGIEIPNESIDTIYLREILESDIFQKSSSSLTVALGKDIVGNPFVTDIKKLPHLLIAGTTGSGKSVGINAMILSLLYRNDPDQLKLMLIDPKMLEFSMYNDIPHLITPVITEPIKAIAALANMVGEMERRYKLMADSRTKNIENYNEKVKKEKDVEPFPFIVIVIDELADLMMNGGKEVELSIARLAQKSRACGIHLVVATQRPSVDVVTGLIKANLPSRLSYRVGTRIDSKVILDALGADSLLGRGDGLFTPPGSTGLVRIHAPWNTEDEIDEIVEFLKAQRLPEYDESYLVSGGATAQSDSDEDIILDSLYEEAKSVVLSDQKTSISYLQRKLQIGYNRSANIIEQLEQKGVLSAPNAKGNREIL